MRSRRRFALFVISLAVVPALLAADSGFDGKWVLDKKRTRAADVLEDYQTELKQNGSVLTVKSKYREPKSNIYPLLWVGVMTYELELPTDGTEKVTQIGPFAHNSKTRMDGNKMTTDFTASYEGGKVDGQWIRTLSDDGREMTMQVIATASDGRRLDQMLYFKRK